MKCTAPWYELNISAPDNIVSACCYYAGEKEPWSEETTSIDTYWNGPRMQMLRRLQARLTAAGNEPTAESHGCSNCFYFENTRPGAAYYDFSVEPLGVLSDAQRKNWQLARKEHAAGFERVECTPLRLYMNFGFACNINCIMCHQVPRRRDNRRQVYADNILAWRDALKAALSVVVIGGEPFALPEAIRFLRTFIPDPDFDAVRLDIHTNGTTHHKHMDLLRKKRKLHICVSLDSISKGYEHIRSGAQWDLVERNMMMIKEAMQTDRPEWGLTTVGLMLKTSVPFLPEFAAWHVKHDIRTGFYDFVNAPGVEDTYYRENILNNPEVLNDIPNWQHYFTEAAMIFRDGGHGYAADNLDNYVGRIEAAREASSARSKRHRLDRSRNDWTPVLDGEAPNLTDSLSFYSLPSAKEPHPIDIADEPVRFTRYRAGDHFYTTFQAVDAQENAGRVRLLARWHSNDPDLRLAHLIVQDQNYSEIVCVYEWRSGPSGSELIMTGNVPVGTTAIRVAFYPTGEDDSYLPLTINLDVNPEIKVAAKTIEIPLAPTVALPDESVMPLQSGASAIPGVTKVRSTLSAVLRAIGVST